MLVSAARRLAPGEGTPAGSGRPLVIAHRGATRHAPENSLEAFDAAIAAGADMVELDVRRSSDGVLVVHHDSTAHGLPVARLSYEQLRELRDAVTTLDEALRLCGNRISVDVEIKVPGIEPAVVEVLRGSLDRDQTVITSFRESVITATKRMEPGLVCGLLIGPSRLRARTLLHVTDPREWLGGIGAQFLLPHQSLARPRRQGRSHRLGMLSRLAERGIPVVVWTVNRPERLARYMQDPRVAGVVTDAPELAAAAEPVAVTGSPRPRSPSRLRANSTP